MSESQVVNSVQPQVGEPGESSLTQVEKQPLDVNLLQPQGITKASVRKCVWEYFTKNKLAVFPPHFGRIPNFADAEQASAKLLELDVFLSAKSVEVTPEKALEFARMMVLSHKKDLYVPCPGFEQGLTKIELTMECDLKTSVSRRGMESLGRRLDANENIYIDLMVLGSVAVSVDGRRIGEGQGYADMEYAMLKEIKAVDDKTTIVTIVHDSQVFDIPKEIFKKYDLPVDYIITPTRIIKVESRLPKPEGIFWDEFTERRLRHKKFLKKLKAKHQREGRDTTLREETEDDRQQKNLFPRPTRFFRRRPKPYTTNEKTGKVEIKRISKSKRKIPSPVQKEEGTPQGDFPENNENIRPSAFIKRKKKNKHIDYSLRVGNIQKTVRVRDLKNALREKGIKPSNISWKGNRGYCFLHYSKPKELEAEVEDENNQESDSINNVIFLIQELKINPDSEKNLSVKVMQPITRIETVNYTAV